MENNIKHNTNSAGESRQFDPDPIIQAKDGSSVSHKGLQPMEIVHSPNKPASVADVTLLPNQFTRMELGRQAAPSIIELLMSILRFKWMILVVFIIVAAPGIFIAWTQMGPMYQARGEVRIRPIIPRLVFSTENNGTIPFYKSFVNTQVSIMKSQIILQRILYDVKVKNTQWYKNPPKSYINKLCDKLRGYTPSNIVRLRNNLQVRPRRGTEIVDISFMAANAEEAKVIVQAALDQYIKYYREKSEQTDLMLDRQLLEQQRSLASDIQLRENIIAEQSKSLGTNSPDELINNKRVHMSATENRLRELRQRITVLEWEVKQTNTDDINDDMDDSNDVAVAAATRMEEQPKYYEDNQWLSLDMNMKTIEHQIANSLLTSKHQSVVRMKKDLEFAETLLLERQRQLDEQWLNRQKNPLAVPITITNANNPGYKVEVGSMSPRHELDLAKQEEKVLIAELDTLKDEFAPLFKSAQILNKANNDLQNKRKLFEAVRQRLEQKNVERGVPGSIDVLMSASTTSEPASDRRITFTGAALFMGFGMGVGLAFLRVIKNQAIYTPKDMPYGMQVPLLGYIPITNSRRSRGRSLASVYSEKQQDRSHLNESVRIARTTLLSRLNGHSNTTLLITSSQEATGKSAFTMMLGMSLAQAGKKVLIVDADFYKMSLTNQFKLSDKAGLIESLSGSSPSKRYVYPTETPGLSIMPVGKRNGDSAVFEQTANGAFKAFIRQHRKQYNIILLDSPPILPVADATILSGQVDGTIVVERELLSRRVDMIDALSRLHLAGGRILGTIFIGSANNEKYDYAYHYNQAKNL